MNNEKCKVCGGTRCVYTGPIGEPPEECEACFDQQPAAPTTSDAGTIDTPIRRYEMATEYNKYACADEVIERLDEDGLWVRYADHLQHVAAAVADIDEDRQRAMGVIARLEAELAKLRSTAGVGAPAAVPACIQSAFVTLESNYGFYSIVMKFNQRENAIAAHEFLLGLGSRESQSAGAPVSAAEQAGDKPDEADHA